MNQNENDKEKRDHLETMIHAQKEIERLQIALHEAEALNAKQEKTLDTLRNDYRTFVARVAAMRDTQKQYFKTRSQEVLNASKHNEKDVDKAIQDYRSREASTELPFG